MGLQIAESGSRAAATPARRVVLSCNGLRVHAGSAPLIDGVSFDVLAGEAYGLVGPAGAGKTAVLSAVCGLAGVDAGTVTAGGLGYVAADATILTSGTVLDNLRCWARIRRVPWRGGEVLSLAGLAGNADDPIAGCPPGTLRALGLAVALLPAPQLLVLDEPTLGLPPAAARRLLATLRRLRDSGTALLYATRRVETARSLCDRVGVLDQGRLKEIRTCNHESWPPDPVGSPAPCSVSHQSPSD